MTARKVGKKGRAYAVPGVEGWQEVAEGKLHLAFI
jgi:hypothetical protein